MTRWLCSLALVAWTVGCGNGSAPTDADSGTVVPAQVSASTSSVELAQNPVEVGTPLSITVTARDDAGRAVADAAVSLTVSGSGHQLLPAAGSTDAEGRAVFFVLSQRAESKTLAVTVGGAALPELTITFLPGAPERLAFTVQPVDVEQNVAMTPAPQLTTLDAFGNVSTVPVRVSLSLRGGSEGAVLGGTTTVATENGLAGFPSLFVDRIGAGYTLSASAPSLPSLESGAFTVHTGVPDALTSRVEVSPSSLPANGTDEATISVIVRDLNGSVLAGRSVSIGANGSGNTITQLETVTDGEGRITATLRSVVAESKTVSVVVDGALTLLSAPQVVFTPGAPDAVMSRVTATPTGGIVADGVQTALITIEAFDAFGNPVSGADVLLSASGAGATLTQPGATNAAGLTTGTLASSVAEVKTITATIGEVLFAASPTVEFAPGAVDAAVSTLTATPLTGVASGGIDFAQVRVTVRDAFGNPIAGRAVVLAAVDPDVTLTQPAAVTDAAGLAIGEIRSATDGDKLVSATVDGTVALVQTVSVPFATAPVSATASTLEISPAGGVVADNAAQISITVTARLFDGTPLSDRSVLVSVSGLNNLVQPGPRTLADGIALAKVSSPEAGTKTVTATIDGVTLAATPTLTFFAGAPDALSSSATLSKDRDILADGVDTTVVRMVVRDRYGNPISGHQLASPVVQAGSVATEPPPTDAQGNTESILTSTVSGPRTFQAAPTPLITAGFRPGPAVAAGSSLVADRSEQYADSTSRILLTATFVDAFGNLVEEGRTVSFTATGLGNIFSPGEVISSGASGQTPVRLAASQLGLRTVTATLENVSVSTDVRFLFPATTVTWVGNDSSGPRWSAGGNWSTAFVPREVDTALITTSGANFPTVDVQAGNGNRVRALIVDPGASATLAFNAELHVLNDAYFAGELSGTGILRVGSGSATIAQLRGSGNRAPTRISGRTHVTATANSGPLRIEDQLLRIENQRLVVTD